MVSGLVQENTGTGTFMWQAYPPSIVAFPYTPLIELACGESPRAAAADYYTSRTGNQVHLVTGVMGGALYSQVKKGTQPWTNMEVSLESAGARLGFPCAGLYVEHGESDHQNLTSRAQYAVNLSEWQTDFQNECNASTPTRNVTAPLFIAQFSSWTAGILINHATTSPIPMAVYDAARAYPERIKLIGPHYYITHGGDGVHPANTNRRTMGAMAGKAMAVGPTWQPLWPRLTSPVSRSTNVITVYLYTPVPPLVVDTTNITGVSATTRGFEYTDDSSPPSITAVDCSAACSGNTCSCQITLSGTPTGANKKLRYAYTGVDGNFGGPSTGPRGNIRDSDTATWQGANLYNWLVHFEEAVP